MLISKSVEDEYALHMYIQAQFLAWIGAVLT